MHRTNNHRKLDQLRIKFESHIQILPNGCWYWLGNKNRMGYGRIGYCGQVYLAHRVALFLYGDFDLFSPLEACHRCDNPPCVNPDHLFEGTHKENMSQSFKRGRSKLAPKYYGEANKLAKFTNEQAAGIRSLYQTGDFTQRELAKEFGVCQATIRDIVNKRSYIDVDNPGQV